MERDTTKDDERIQLQVDLADLVHDRYGAQVTGGNLRDDGGIDVPLTWKGAAKMLADLRDFGRLAAENVRLASGDGIYDIAFRSGAVAERARIRTAILEHFDPGAALRSDALISTSAEDFHDVVNRLCARGGPP